MKRRMSEMTADEFVLITGALGLKYIELAAQINRSHAMVSLYVNGKRPIPYDVATNLNQLLTKRRKYLAEVQGVAEAALTTTMDVLVATNEIRHRRDNPSGLHNSELTLYRRLETPKTNTLPLYRLTRERYAIFVGAIKLWNDEVVRRLKTILEDDSRIRMHRLELADIKAIAGAIPRNVPYDVCITEGEWDVVSRALRFAEKEGREGARALYCHWRTHRYAGFPTPGERRQVRSDIQVTQTV